MQIELHGYRLKGGQIEMILRDGEDNWLFVPAKDALNNPPMLAQFDAEHIETIRAAHEHNEQRRPMVERILREAGVQP